MTPREVGRRGGRAAIVAGALLGLLWVRALAEARFEASQAAEAREKGDVAAAVDSLGRAVRWMAPLNFYADDALDALLEVAEAQERRGDVEAALRTYRVASGSLLASAGLVRLRADTLAHVRARIQTLRASRADPSFASPPPDEPPGGRALRRAAHQAPWSRLLALGGFVLWVAAAFALAALGTTPAARRRFTYGALLAVGLSCFGVGLWWS